MPRIAPASTPRSGARAASVSYLGAARARRKFEMYYPDGFQDETYLIAERAHKERAHLDWTAQLGPAQLRQLIARGEWRHIADTALRVEARANLLCSYEKMALREALRSPSAARLFACELQTLLDGRGSAVRRFGDWVQALACLPAVRGTVLRWPVATVFGFLGRPDRHLFLKPRVTRRAARAYGFDLGYQPEPSAGVYENLLTFGAILRRDLDRRPGLRARDMIDLQSFIWVQGSEEYAL